MVRGPQIAGSARMGPLRLLRTAVLLLAQAAPWEASQHCGRLEYWNPDNRCCGSCLQRFGPPPCSGEERETGRLYMFGRSYRVMGQGKGRGLCATACEACFRVGAVGCA